MEVISRKGAEAQRGGNLMEHSYGSEVDQSIVSLSTSRFASF